MRHLAAHQILLDAAPGGAAVLDLVSGKTTKAASGLVATCRSKARFAYGQPYYVNDKPIWDHTAGELVAFCTSSGRQPRCHPGMCCAMQARPSPVRR